jgi:S-formylglutathione hydrolase FrmB
MRRVLAAMVGLMALALAPAAARAVTFRSGDGLTVTAIQRLDARLLALTVRTAALPAPANIRILLPDGYATHPRTRYPVLYLLHGTSGRASDWTTQGGAEATTAGRPLIVVMPDIDLNGDGGGWCTDWPDGRYRWETFHIDQLIPWVDRNLRTIASRAGRAVAGLSQGGFCSMSYAAQHPDIFSAALAFSGAPDIAYDPVARAGALAIINATEVGLDHVPANSMFGNPVHDYLNYADHDPATLAANLRSTSLYMYFGNGLPGPLDPLVPNPAASAIEMGAYQDNIFFHARLVSLGIVPTVYDAYGNGTHSWPYWARDLRESIGPLMAGFAHPAPPPATFTYTSGFDSYSVYGWRVVMHRAAQEFSTLQNAGSGGFTLLGSGSATVTTPARYRRRARYLVTIRPTGAVVTTAVSRADRRGRLIVTVPLGPSDTVQEYSNGGPPASSPGTVVHTTSVTITRRAG